MVNAMKNIDDLTIGNYIRDVINISIKKILVCLIIIVIGIIIIFKVSFKNYNKYYIIKNENIYSILIPYDEKNIWLNNNELIIDKKKYKYKITNISNYLIKENNVYLQLEVNIKKFQNNEPILESQICNKNMTILKYIKETLWR